MASTTAKGSGSTNNNGGVVVNGGSNAAGKFTTALESRNMTKDEKQYGTKVVEMTAGTGDTEDIKGVIKADSGGTFSYFPNPRTDDLNVLAKAGGSQSAKINNQSAKGNLLTVPGSEFASVERGKPNQVNGSTALGNPTWTYPTMGMPSTSRVPGLNRDETEGSGYTYRSTTGDTDGADKNVFGTRTLAVPGEVTYRFGGPSGVTTDFRARDNVDA